MTCRLWRYLTLQWRHKTAILNFELPPWIPSMQSYSWQWRHRKIYEYVLRNILNQNKHKKVKDYFLHTSDIHTRRFSTANFLWQMIWPCTWGTKFYLTNVLVCVPARTFEQRNSNSSRRESRKVAQSKWKKNVIQKCKGQYQEEFSCVWHTLKSQ